MDKIKVNTGKSTIFSSCVAIFHNFLNQGFVYMILEEKIVKILLEISLFCILLFTGFSYITSMFAAHAINWIFNGQIWVLSRYVYTLNLFKHKKVLKFLYITRKIVSRIGALDCLISGSITEGRQHNNSDIDIRIVASGRISAIFISFIAVYLRFLAFLYLVPLDIFVIDSYDGLSRLKNEKKFLSILDKNSILADGRSIISNSYRE